MHRMAKKPRTSLLSPFKQAWKKITWAVYLNRLERHIVEADKVMDAFSEEYEKSADRSDSTQNRALLQSMANFAGILRSIGKFVNKFPEAFPKPFKDTLFSMQDKWNKVLTGDAAGTEEPSADSGS